MSPAPPKSPFAAHSAVVAAAAAAAVAILLAAPPARAEGLLSLEVGIHSQSRLFALASNDSPIPVEVLSLELTATDPFGAVVYQYQKVLREPLLVPPGLAKFVRIPLPPSVPADAIGGFDAVIRDTVGQVVAADSYRNDVGVSVTRYDAATSMVYVTLKNTTDSTISVTEIQYKKYEPRHVITGTIRLQPPQNIGPGNTTAEICLAIPLGAGHSVVLKAVDPEGTVVGKGSYSR
jgi:hypothetical protein